MSDRSAAEALSAEDQRRAGWLVPMSDAEVAALEGVYFYDDGYAAADDVQRLLATLDRERAAAPTLGIEEAIARGQAMLAASEAAADREITRLNDRIVALNAEVLDRMDQWHRDSLARDELARQQAAEIARLREADRERSEAVTLALTELRREVEGLAFRRMTGRGLDDGGTTGDLMWDWDEWEDVIERAGVLALIDKAVPR